MNMDHQSSPTFEDQVEELKAKFGKPQVFTFSADFLNFECDLVKRSAAKGRNHDITCFIRKDGQYVVIQKHQYAQTGIYRAPSGGTYPGEDLEDAAEREMYEETGLQVDLKKFVMDVRLEVRCPDETIPWRSLVFLAEAVDGDLHIIDDYEIYNVRLMSREEMLGSVDALMVESGWGGFEYRSFLTRSFFETLDELDDG